MRHFDKLSASHGRAGQVNVNALPVRGRVVCVEFGEEPTKVTVTLLRMIGRAICLMRRYWRSCWGWIWRGRGI